MIALAFIVGLLAGAVSRRGLVWTLDFVQAVIRTPKKTSTRGKRIRVDLFTEGQKNARKTDSYSEPPMPKD